MPRLGPIRELLGKGKVVLLAVPGAFTPTCSNIHLPGYVERVADLKAKGVDTIACISVNDAWVMDEWGESQGVGDDIVMIADGNGALHRRHGPRLRRCGDRPAGTLAAVRRAHR